MTLIFSPPYLSPALTDISQSGPVSPLSHLHSRTSASTNPRFPIYIKSYNVTAQRKAWDVYSKAISGADNPYYNSIFMFEDYASTGVRFRINDASAFGIRDAHTLAAPLIIYTSTGKAQDNAVKELGTQLCDIIREGTGSKELHTYVKYAYGDEGAEGLVRP